VASGEKGENRLARVIGKAKAIAVKEDQPFDLTDPDFKFKVQVCDPFIQVIKALSGEFAKYFPREVGLIFLGITNRMNEIKSRLKAKNPLEELLVESIITNWLEGHLINLSVSKIVNPAIKDAYIKRQMSAQKRYHSSIKTLAQLKKISASSIQLELQNKLMLEKLKKVSS
jgi:hypothetical protein